MGATSCKFICSLAGMIVSLSCAMVLASPPHVIKAIPDNGATNVDPTLTELRVTFDQPMNTGGFSFCGGGDSFPGSGRPHWIDDRTCAMPISLKPEHRYALNVNCPSAQNFRSAGGEPATPYLIIFFTAAPAGAKPLTPQANDDAMLKLRLALDKDYSYINVHKVDWNQALADDASQLEQSKTPLDFANAAGKILARANDLHIWLKVGDAIVPSAIRRIDPNCSIAVLMRQVPNFAVKNTEVLTGQYDDGITYIMIRDFTGDPSTLAPAMDALANAKAAIIDVRTNSGGDELLAQQFAGCFVTTPHPYAKDIIRSNGQDSQPLDRMLRPNAQRSTFTGKVALLIGPENMSSCESFIMMMKTNPNCTTIGEKTWGSSGNPQPHDLGNGVTVMLPSWRDLFPDGTSLESHGITPDIAIPAGAEGGDDPVLNRALQLLRAPGK